MMSWSPVWPRAIPLTHVNHSRLVPKTDFSSELQLSQPCCPKASSSFGDAPCWSTLKHPECERTLHSLCVTCSWQVFSSAVPVSRMIYPCAEQGLPPVQDVSSGTQILSAPTAGECLGVLLGKMLKPLQERSQLPVLSHLNATRTPALSQILRKMKYSNTWKFLEIEIVFNTQYFYFFFYCSSFFSSPYSHGEMAVLGEQGQTKKGKVTYQKRADSLGFLVKKNLKKQRNNPTNYHSLIGMVNY